MGTWREHLAATRRKHPQMPMALAMKEASKTWTKKAAPPKKGGKKTRRRSTKK